MSRSKRTVTITPGEDAAIYCRISHVKDEDQTGVDRQERICREIAERLQLRVEPDHVYVDNNRSAWQRNRKRPGWDKMLKTMSEGAIRHVIVYHPDRLMRQPKDLEELLSVADDKRVLLHGEANRRDLSDPDDRFILRIEVAHACRSSDDTSRRLKDSLEDKARAGSPHVGNRPYGYTKDGRTIVEAEAEIVREVYRRYLDGESPAAISQDLHARKILTSKGKTWGPENVRNLLSSNFVAGIRIHRGEEVGPGSWPAIIDRGQWDEVQQQRTHRAARIEKERKRPDRYYLLRGVVTCTCGMRMAGTNGGRYAYYRCTRAALNGEQKCGRSVSAGPLEEFVRAVAIKGLEEMDVTGREPVTTVRPEADVRADDKDQRKLRELNQLWLSDDDFTMTDYQSMRAVIMQRIKERQRKTVQRPIAVLEGIVGPDAKKNWQALEKKQDYARMNAIYRFLFSAIVVHPPKSLGRGFDTDRIEVQANPLP
ncbi:recombinase family protein [Streptomyces sp. H10-C2]|uniref:recombinase family protein n=1 Tax=unclassified Streptomyces TaxID=2593676 RepID=UPI0024B9D228|nr:MULTISPECIES: recombinase family protein [unclassified Streptomyces]MDJ0341387.1 recombinase family protein [Streptomyces sp. PH10-H1]MDJ0370982.1 recombinase family protein [Streptomyces sp. H10-C2]